MPRYMGCLPFGGEPGMANPGRHPPSLAREGMAAADVAAGPAAMEPLQALDRGAAGEGVMVSLPRLWRCGDGVSHIAAPSRYSVAPP